MNWGSTRGNSCGRCAHARNVRRRGRRNGYWALVERGEPGEVYNLCSGKSWAIQWVLDFLLEQSQVKGISVQTDPTRLRPSDVMVLEGDPSKIEKATGWKVEIPFERTLKDLLGYWRQRTWSSSR